MCPFLPKAGQRLSWVENILLRSSSVNFNQDFGHLLEIILKCISYRRNRKRRKEKFYGYVLTVFTQYIPTTYILTLWSGVILVIKIVHRPYIDSNHSKETITNRCLRYTPDSNTNTNASINQSLPNWCPICNFADAINIFLPESHSRF